MAIPFHTLTLDKPYKLRLGMGEMISYEQITGKKLQDIDEGMSFETACQLLLIMVKTYEPDMTMEHLTDLVNEYANTMTDIISAVSTAIQYTFIGKKESSPNAKAPTAKK